MRVEEEAQLAWMLEPCALVLHLHRAAVQSCSESSADVLCGRERGAGAGYEFQVTGHKMARGHAHAIGICNAAVGMQPAGPAGCGTKQAQPVCGMVHVSPGWLVHRDGSNSLGQDPRMKTSKAGRGSSRCLQQPSLHCGSDARNIRRSQPIVCPSCRTRNPVGLVSVPLVGL